MRDTDFLGAGDPGALDALLGIATGQGALIALAEAYRRFGWRAAFLDPLGLVKPAEVPELDATFYGLLPEDADPFRAAYCGSLGWQIGHIQDAQKRHWLASEAERAWHPVADARRRALRLIAQSERLEATFDRRMPGAKTFGLSGADGYVALLGEVLHLGALNGAQDCIIGGMHRGRLTQMGLVFGKPLARIVADSMGIPEYAAELGASSDSPYHLGWEGPAQTDAGEIGIWIAPHPSHLSVVAPVGQGRARAAQDQGRQVLPLSLHTDAAFSGQGINAELMQLSGLPAFGVGGTIHLILNNQVGFTTGASDAQTASSIANVARMIDAPILHVNGDDPDAVLRAAMLAGDWRQKFGADIIVDLIAYRRKGHNEIDEPRFTQPKMYAAIDAMPSLASRYADTTGTSPDLEEFTKELDVAFEAAKHLRANDTPAPIGLAAGIEARMLESVDTGVSADLLQSLGHRLTDLPSGVSAHPKVASFLKSRAQAIETGLEIDWSTAEALALASLLDDNVAVRLGGQDSMRGAFTQRHLDVHCQKTQTVWNPLKGFSGQASLHNTPLIENAVLAFEYGYSQQALDGLTIWEAQFGDFLNVAQAIFDQFIICGEDRWLSPSNLVILLPHGVDGGGPDHATAHPERLLAACANGNIQVINPSTPANYFHALRRQVRAEWRKPLVVLAPKTLLRHPKARSQLSAFNQTFEALIAEKRTAPRLVLSTGKLAVLLEQERDRRQSDTALARLEQLYPLDTGAIARLAGEHPDAELIWAQEEPENMGYFQWLDRRLEDATGRRWRCVSRPASPSAASGPKAWDDAHLETVISQALGKEK